MPNLPDDRVRVAIHTFEFQDHFVPFRFIRNFLDLVLTRSLAYTPARLMALMAESGSPIKAYQVVSISITSISSAIHH